MQTDFRQMLSHWHSKEMWMRSKMQDNVELVDNRFYIIGRQDKSKEYTGGRKSMEELVRDWNWINSPLYSIINRRITKHRKMQI